MTPTARPVRFFVYNPGENHAASYNAALGKDALSWAHQNARRYHGRIMAETSDGALVLYKSYEWRSEPAQNPV